MRLLMTGKVLRHTFHVIGRDWRTLLAIVWLPFGLTSVLEICLTATEAGLQLQLSSTFGWLVGILTNPVRVTLMAIGFAGIYRFYLQDPVFSLRQIVVRSPIRDGQTGISVPAYVQFDVGILRYAITLVIVSEIVNALYLAFVNWSSPILLFANEWTITLIVFGFVALLRTFDAPLYPVYVYLALSGPVSVAGLIHNLRALGGNRLRFFALIAAITLASQVSATVLEAVIPRPGSLTESNALFEALMVARLAFFQLLAHGFTLVIIVLTAQVHRAFGWPSDRPVQSN